MQDATTTSIELTTPPVTRRSKAVLFTWSLVALVIVIVIALIGVKLTEPSAQPAPRTFTPTSQDQQSALTSVPPAVFNTIGVTSPLAPVVGPSPTISNSELFVRDQFGHMVPEVFFYGSELCSYCGAERWPLIIALSRFGTISDLGNTTTTGKPQVFPWTTTFTLTKVNYVSKYLAFRAVETYSGATDDALDHVVLESPTQRERQLINAWDVPPQSPVRGALPFVSIANRFVIGGSQFTPAILTGQSRAQVISALSDPTAVTTPAIIASANLLTAAMCIVTNGLPTSTCQSPGVTVASAQLGR